MAFKRAVVIAGMHRSGLRLVRRDAEAGGSLQLKLDNTELLISASRLLCAHMWKVLNAERATVKRMEICEEVNLEHLT